MLNSTHKAVQGPPANRLWDDDYLAALVGFQSIDELIARHPALPTPVPFPIQGRRWRPADFAAWIDALCPDSTGLLVPKPIKHGSNPPPPADIAREVGSLPH